MSTPREIFLETIRPDGRPERILDQYEALGMVLNDPINTYLRGNRRRGTTSLDRWGTTITWPEDAPGSMPLHGPELTVLQDVTRWRETVHAPDIEANCAGGWEDALAHPSMEAYGLMVADVCALAGLKYYYGPNSISYTSCILIN